MLSDELGCTPGPGVREVFGRLLHGAKQDDEDPLAALMDAVVRLHVAVSSPDDVVGSRQGGQADGHGGKAVVEDDWRLLERFLSLARSRWLPSARATA